MKAAGLILQSVGILILLAVVVSWIASLFEIDPPLAIGCIGFLIFVAGLAVSAYAKDRERDKKFTLSHD